MEANTEKESTIIDDNLSLGCAGPFEDDDLSDCPAMLLFLSLLDGISFDFVEEKKESGD